MEARHFSDRITNMLPHTGVTSVYRHYIALKDNKKLIASSSVSIGFLVALMSVMRPEVFEASFAIAPAQYASSSSLSLLAAQVGLGSAKPNVASPAFLSELIVSREVLRSVVTAKYSSLKGREIGTDLAAFLGVDTKSRNIQIDATNALRSTVSTYFDRNTGIIRVAVQMRDSAVALEVARKIIDATDRKVEEQRRMHATQERAFTAAQIADAGARLDSVEVQLTEFLRGNRGWESSPKLSRVHRELERAVSIEEGAYLALTQALSAARMQEYEKGGAIELVEAPEGYVRALPRNTLLRSFVAATFALIATMALIMGRAAWQLRRVNS